MDTEESQNEYFKLSQRGQALLEIGRWNEALHEFNALLARYPQDYFSLCNSAVCYLNLGQFQKAYEITKLAIESEPEDEWAYRIQSIIFSTNGENNRALDAARLAAEKCPYDPIVVHRLFEAEVNYGLLDDAEKTLERFSEMAPGDAVVFESRAYLRLSQERLQEAEKDYLEAIKLDPENANSFNNLGVIYLKFFENGSGNKYKKMSVDMFERAVKLSPTFTLAQNNMSMAANATKGGIAVGGLISAFFAMSALNGLVNSGGKGAAKQLKNFTLADLNPFVGSSELILLNLIPIILLAIYLVSSLLLLSKGCRNWIFGLIKNKYFLFAGFAVHLLLAGLFINIIVGEEGNAPKYEEIAGAISVVFSLAYVSGLIYQFVHGSGSKESIISN